MNSENEMKSLIEQYEERTKQYILLSVARDIAELTVEGKVTVESWRAIKEMMKKEGVEFDS